MKKLTAALALTTAFALPTAAFAGCGPWQQGSTSVSCEQGVQVFRSSQPHLPSISPTNAAKLDIQRATLAQRQREAQARDRIARDRVALDYARLNQTDYLYRDLNSPLRQTGFNTGFSNGFVGGFGGGFVPGFQGGFAPGFQGGFQRGFAPGFQGGFQGGFRGGLRSQRVAIGTPARGQLAPVRGVAQPIAAPARRVTSRPVTAPRPMPAAPMKKHY